MDKVIFTDLDGTLFYPKRRASMIAKSNVKFLRRFIDEGGKAVIVSSRGPQFAREVQRKIGRPIDCVGCNGTFIMKDGKIVSCNAFKAEELLDLIEDLRKDYGPDLFLLTTLQYPLVIPKTGTGKWTKFVYNVFQFSQGVLAEDSVTSDQLFYSEINKGNALKLMMLVGITPSHKALAERITKKLVEKYPDYDIVWLGEFIEITPKGCNKASGISFYLDYAGISKDNVIVVGDSGNDVPMFRMFNEHSYCMEHSPLSIRNEAKHTVRRVSDLMKVLYPSADSTTEKEGK